MTSMIEFFMQLWLIGVVSHNHNHNEPLGALAPPLVGGGGPHRGGGVGMPRAHDRYIINTSFTLYPNPCIQTLTPTTIYINIIFRELLKPPRLLLMPPRS